MGGVRTYVWQRRLDRVYAALRAPALAPCSIDLLARDHGFPSAARLTTAVHKRFDVLPDDIVPMRPGDPAGSGINERGELDRAAHDVFIDWLRVGETV